MRLWRRRTYPSTPLTRATSCCKRWAGLVLALDAQAQVRPHSITCTAHSASQMPPHLCTAACLAAAARSAQEAAKLCRARARTGRTAPIDTAPQAAGSRAGLGRSAQEEELIASETARRRALATEAQVCEGEAQRAQRLERAEAQSRVKETVKEMQRDFYCEARAAFACSHVLWRMLPCSLFTLLSHILPLIRPQTVAAESTMPVAWLERAVCALSVTL